MRWLASGVCMLAVAQLVCCWPAPRDGSLQRSLPQQDVLLDALPLEESSLQDTQRDKRTLGLIRQYFPGLARIIDSKIQMITRWVFRVVGRLVLRGGLLGGGGGGGSGGGNSSGSGGGRRVSIVLPTFPPSEEDDEEDTSSPDTSTDVQNPEDNQLSGAESRVYESRVAPPSGFFDLQPAASSDDAQVAASEDDAVAEGSEDGDESRSKRLISFAGGSGGGGSGGGSGNFIFDILRLVTGSSNTETTDDASAGAGAQASAGGAADAAVEKDDGYQAGIPGPITRLFILTNRGIANLVQDLILRLAQTSERIVNFKARLITAII